MSWKASLLLLLPSSLSFLLFFSLFLFLVQVKQVRVVLPSSARKDGVALEGQLAHFQQLLEEGSDAEAAYLAEQLLVGQLHYLISM